MMTEKAKAASGASVPEGDALQEKVLQIRQYLSIDKASEATEVIRHSSPPDIARIMEALPEDERASVWQGLGLKSQIEVTPSLSAAVRDKLVSRFTPQEALVAITEALPTDEAADLLQALPKKDAAAVVEDLGPKADQTLERVAAMPADQAGGLMNTDVVRIRPSAKLGEVIATLRKEGGLPANTDELIVTGRKGKYLGSLTLGALLAGNPSSPVKKCMRTDRTVIPVDWHLDKVASRFTDEALLSAPVLDQDGIVLGRITVDDIAKMLNRKVSDTMLRMGGLPNESDLFAPVMKSAWRRSIWLCANLFTAFLASWAIGWFEEGLSHVVALAILMPVVASMGGVAGSQTLTVTVRGLALGQLGRANTTLLIKKEIAVAAINGLVWMALAAYIAFTWFNQLSMALIFGFSIFMNLLIAALAGVVIPIVMRRMGIDPAIAGSVVLTTVTDVVGFVTFLGLGSLILLA